MKTKLIMLAHGSSNQSWSDAFFEMTQGVRERFPSAELAFMELSTPSLNETCRTAARDGYTLIRVLPLFLSTGRHLKKDVPKIIESLTSELSLKIELLPPIGEQDRIRNAIVDVVCDELEAGIS